MDVKQRSDVAEAVLQHGRRGAHCSDHARMTKPLHVQRLLELCKHRTSQLDQSNCLDAKITGSSTPTVLKNHQFAASCKERATTPVNLQPCGDRGRLRRWTASERRSRRRFNLDAKGLRSKCLQDIPMSISLTASWLLDNKNAELC